MSAFSSTLPPGAGQKHLILLGAGQSHLDVLAHWAVHPVAGVQVTLVTPHAIQLDSAFLPDLVTGHLDVEACATPLEPLLHNSGVRWLKHHAVGLDVQTQTVMLDDGNKIHYDWLSVNTGLVQDRARINQSMPGALENALFVQPPQAFAELWPRVLELPAGEASRVAVIGADTLAIELALAIRYRLPHTAITLVTDGVNLAAHLPPAVQTHLERALKKRKITVLVDRAVGLKRGEAMLGCGARLACDVPVVTAECTTPLWLTKSGLALDEAGQIAVDTNLCSPSHPNVFVAGRLAATGGATGLATNLAAAVQGSPLLAVVPKHPSAQFLSYGDGSAVGWAFGLAAEGRWVNWWKNRAGRANSDIRQPA